MRGYRSTSHWGVRNLLPTLGTTLVTDRMMGCGVTAEHVLEYAPAPPFNIGTLSRVAESLGASPLAVALAWLLQRSPNILLIAGTSSVEHPRENVVAAALRLPGDAVRALDEIGARRSGRPAAHRQPALPVVRGPRAVRFVNGRSESRAASRPRGYHSDSGEPAPVSWHRLTGRLAVRTAHRPPA